MRRALLPLTLLTLTLLTTTAFAAETRTYALIVANNGSVDEGVKPLRYADDDGARYYELFSNLATETHLLTVLDRDSQKVFPTLAAKTLPPTRRQLRQTVAGLKAKIDADRAAGRRAELYLIFTGHGNVDEKKQGYLSLQDGKLRRAELYRDVLRPLNASYTHLIIDACHAFHMVQSRGGKGTWSDDRSGQTRNEEFQAYLKRGKKRRSALPSTVGVILSTSGTAEVHEWRKYRGGVFSHQLRSGLLGGADANGDGAVSYAELDAFFAAANAAVQTPKAQLQVHTQAPAQDTQHPLVRLDAYGPKKTTLELRGDAKRYYIEDARGLRYADVHTAQGHPTRLVMLHEPVAGRDYFLNDTTRQARVALNGAKVSSQKLAFREVEDQARGAVDAAYRKGLFAVPFGPSFMAGYMASRSRYEDLLDARDVATTTPQGPGVELGFGYGLSQSPLVNYRTDALGLSGLQHNLELDVRLGDQGLMYGAFLSYGVSPGERATGHRVALGGQVGYRFAQDRLSVAPLLRLAPQALLLQGGCAEGQTCADPIGLRTEASLGLGWSFSEAFALELRGGWALDVTTFANATGAQEQVTGTPFVGVGARF